MDTDSFIIRIFTENIFGNIAGDVDGLIHLTTLIQIIRYVVCPFCGEIVLK